MRTVNVDTPHPAAITASFLPWASSSRIRSASSGVSFHAPRGPFRAGTSPATPSSRRARSHRHTVTGSVSNAAATCLWAAARSLTSCTAARRRAASSPASQAKVASPCTHTTPPPSLATTPTPGAISSASPGSHGSGTWTSIAVIIPPRVRIL